MTATQQLPPGLEPWSESLAFLTVESAIHVGPLVTRLDALVRQHDAARHDRGEPDGYRGLTVRGHPERMLLSEWLLADELPLEFLRRASARELLHLETAYRGDGGSGRVAVVFDVGPDQLGACRLVQLAALVVLHRRAASNRRELVISTTADPAGTWHTGELPELFAAWRARRRVLSDDDLAARRAGLEEPDELWVLAGAELAHMHPSHPLMVGSEEDGWEAEGVATVRLRFEGQTTILALPGGPEAVRALRGAGVRRGRRAIRDADEPRALRHPSFASVDRRALMHGAGAEELVVLSVPAKSGNVGRTHTHRFPGPVLAAASLGKRICVLIHSGDHVEARFIGRPLGRIERVRIDSSKLPDFLPDGGLEPLFYDRGSLLTRLGGSWCTFDPDRPMGRALNIVAVGPGTALDVPYVVGLDDGVLRELPSRRRLADGIDRADLRIICGQMSAAWSTGAEWSVMRGRTDPVFIPIPDDEEVIGIAAGGLVTRSAAAVLVRLRTDSAVRTLTKCSGIALAYSVHPSVPLIAIQRDPTHVEVHDLISGDVLARAEAG